MPAIADTGSTLAGVPGWPFGVLLIALLLAATIPADRWHKWVHQAYLRRARGRTICAICDQPITTRRERWWGLCDRHATALRDAYRRDHERRITEALDARDD